MRNKETRWQKSNFILLALFVTCGTMTLAACGGDGEGDTNSESLSAAAGSGGTSIALTIDNTVGEIMADPNGEAVIRTCFSDERVDDSRFSEMYSMNLPTVAPMSNGQIPDEVVDCVASGLQAVSAGMLQQWIATNPSAGIAITPADDTGGNNTGGNTAPVAEGNNDSLTIDSLLADLLANQTAEAILRECFGELMDNPAIAGVAPEYTLSELAAMSPDLTDEKMQCVKDGLDALPE